MTAPNLKYSINHKCLTKSIVVLLKFPEFLKNPLFLHFDASEVTLSGLAGGECLPLPASIRTGLPLTFG